MTKYCAECGELIYKGRFNEWEENGDWRKADIVDYEDEGAVQCEDCGKWFCPECNDLEDGLCPDCREGEEQGELEEHVA